MSENLKADGGENPSVRACRCKRSLLVRGTPRPAIAAIEYVSFAHAPGCKGVEQNTSFICQYNVPPAFDSRTATVPASLL
jgi:hypothetical protein